MQVSGVSLDLMLIMHEQVFEDYLTDHLISRWKVWAGEQARHRVVLKTNKCRNDYCNNYFNTYKTNIK